MENKALDNANFFAKLESHLKKKKISYFVISFIIILLISATLVFSNYKSNENKKISEKYILAGIYLASDNKDEAKLLYKEVIVSKNKFYSQLALQNLLEHNLENNSNEIIKLFNIVENANQDKDKLDLIKLKKALYLIKISKKNEGEKLLQEIISDNSIWKNIAEGLSR